MVPNRIKDLRVKREMTQRQLAEASGTSQQQIQRIEAGVQSARFDLAVKICTALETPMQHVFPTTRKAITQSREKGNSFEDFLTDEEVEDAMREGGVDMDPREWTFKYRLRGGANGLFPITAAEQNRLWSAVQLAQGFDRFVVFDAKDKRVALNLDHLIFSQFLFDPPNAHDQEEEESREMDVYLADSPEPMTFRVDPDEEDLDDEMADEEEKQLQHMLFMAETSSDDDILNFVDEDGETAFLRAKDVAMIVVPLHAVEPNLLKAEIEDDDEDEASAADHQEAS